MQKEISELSLKNFYKNAHYQILYNAERQVLYMKPKGSPSQVDVKDAWMKALEISKEKKLFRWLSDESEMETIHPLSIKWFKEEWFPLALKELANNPAPITATVVSTRFYAEMSSKISVQEMKKQSEQKFGRSTLLSRYFKDSQEALNWLLEN